MSWITVSAKVRRELYEKLKKYGVPVSKVIREALIEEVRRREEEEISAALGEAQEILKEIPPEEIVAVIRESREER
ncbi:MAG: type II toxin-antitoxin system CcdA family antitoxin [Desulfurococcales archaeon]|nr:type II toxin-antitoxin system CcdA family antitoxin [Desulfurococcales archaeon]